MFKSEQRLGATSLTKKFRFLKLFSQVKSVRVFIMAHVSVRITNGILIGPARAVLTRVCMGERVCGSGRRHAVAAARRRSVER